MWGYRGMQGQFRCDGELGTVLRCRGGWRGAGGFMQRDILLCWCSPWCPPCWAPSPPASCPQCNQFFDLLQDLVDHVNDFHVKPEKDAGYCCHWEGCARHGRGFNAR